MAFRSKWKVSVRDDRRTYNSWNSMNHRCYDPTSVSFPHYGGRGIRVCDRWRESYDNFVEDMGKRPLGTTIDREDPQGDYTPENCRWSTVKYQNQNKRNTPKRYLGGEAKTLAEWARETGVCRETAALRIKRGVPLERALDPRPMREPPAHGTLTRSTGRYRCPCPLCKVAKRDYDRARNAAKSAVHYDL